MFKSVVIALAMFCGLSALPAAAQQSSSRPLTLVVTYPPGGNIDLTARIIAPVLGNALDRTVIVENRAGAGGIIGTQYVARSRADGDTLLMGTANLSTAPFVYKDVPYDPIRDFIPVGGIQSVPLILTASKASGLMNWSQLKGAAAGGKGLTVATAGAGTSNHVTLERIKLTTGLALTHIPYKGSGPAISDLLAGQVDLMVDQLNSSIAQIRGGKMQPIVQFGAVRAAQLPGVPTLQEQGIPGFTATTWVGLFAPAGTPADVIDALGKALRSTLANEDVVKRFDEMGVNRFTMSRAQFTEFVKSDLAASKDIIEKANIHNE